MIPALCYLAELLYGLALSATKTFFVHDFIFIPAAKQTDINSLIALGPMFLARENSFNDKSDSFPTGSDHPISKHFKTFVICTDKPVSPMRVSGVMPINKNELSTSCSSLAN